MLRHAIAPARFFSQVPNEIIRHPRLGSDAVRLLLWQLSLAPGADEPLSESARRAGVKKSGFQRAKEELKAEGFLHEWREQKVRGRWGTVQLVSNVPLTAEEAVLVRDGVPPTDVPPAVGQPTRRVVGRYPEQTDQDNTPNLPRRRRPAGSSRNWSYSTRGCAYREGCSPSWPGWRGSGSGAGTRREAYGRRSGAGCRGVRWPFGTLVGWSGTYCVRCRRFLRRTFNCRPVLRRWWSARVTTRSRSSSNRSPTRTDAVCAVRGRPRRLGAVRPLPGARRLRGLPCGVGCLPDRG